MTDPDVASVPTPNAAPALPETVRQHLGRLLASAYSVPSADVDMPPEFAQLLTRLNAALAEAYGHEEERFQQDLIAAIPSLQRFALSLLHRSSGMDDLVQDTLLRAWRSRTQFQPGTNFIAWLFTILRNSFYREQNRQRREVQDGNGEYTGRIATVADQAGQVDMQDVQTALTKLPDFLREALVLVALEGLSYEQAAMVMNCQVGTVKSRFWRARARLADLLGYAPSEIGTDSLMLSVMNQTGSR